MFLILSFEALLTFFVKWYPHDPQKVDYYPNYSSKHGLKRHGRTVCLAKLYLVTP